MCINYKPPTKEAVIAMTGAISAADDRWPEETWQDYAAPVVLQNADGSAELLPATYGMVPKAHLPPGSRHFTTMNARAETIGQKPSYARAWRQGQTCLVPMSWFCEPNYASGRAERWAIGSADGAPFCVAGLWRQWDEEEGGQALSFTQITINADAHPMMKRFHKPGDEKRSLVIVPREEYGAWLGCRDPEVARSMLNLYPAERMKAWALPNVNVRQQQNGVLF